MRRVHETIFRIIIFIFKNILSSIQIIEGNPKILQPSLFIGSGKICFEKDVILGYFPSPFFFSGYIHIEARDESSIIRFGMRTMIGNSFTAISAGASIFIGRDCLIGTNVEIFSSDFHNINPITRRVAPAPSKDVVIGNNVWIGNSVKILKGVSIGNNSVIGAGSIVTKNIPSNTVFEGNPAKEIRKL